MSREGIARQGIAEQCPERASPDRATRVNRAPDPLTAPVVGRIFDPFASGISAKAIIDRLNSDGSPSPQGSDWSRSTLCGNRTRNDGLLRNATCAGRLVTNATSTLYEPGTGRRKVFATPETRVEVHIPALQIVSDETLAAVQGCLEDFPEGPLGWQRQRRAPAA